MRKLSFIVIGLVCMSLSVNAQYENWIEYKEDYYKIQFLITTDMKIKQRERGNWGMLKGKTKDGIRLVVQATPEYIPMEDIEGMAEKDLKIDGNRFVKQEEGTKNKLKYRTYSAIGADGDEIVSLEVMIAHHATRNYSYLMYVYASETQYRIYKKEFNHWINNIQGL